MQFIGKTRFIGRAGPASQFIVRLVREATRQPAFVAGGALRDSHHEVEVKDIDVFLTWSEHAYDIVHEIFASWRISQVIPKNYVEGMNGVEAVVGFELDGFEWPVNVIFLTATATMESVLGRFDFGLCQIGTDGEDVYVTPAYTEDMLDHTFTVIGTHSPLRSMRRFDRFQEKYPGYRLVCDADFRAEAQLAA